MAVDDDTTQGGLRIYHPPGEHDQPKPSTNFRHLFELVVVIGLSCFQIGQLFSDQNPFIPYVNVVNKWNQKEYASNAELYLAAPFLGAAIGSLISGFLMRNGRRNL